MNEKKLEYLSIDKLIPHEKNPRKALGDLTELAESIKVKGVMQNLTVVPAGDVYKIVIGHRRHGAAQLAGLDVLPCIIDYDMTEEEQVATMLLENIQRSALTIYEEAQGFQMMIDFGKTPEEIAALTGFSNSTVRRRLKMAELDQEKLKELCADEERQISICDVDKLAQIKDTKVKNELLKSVGTSNFDYRYKNALSEQKRKEKLPLVKKALKALGAEEFKKSSDTYSSKYECLCHIYVEDFNEGDKIDIKGMNEKLFWYYGGYQSVAVYTLAKKKPKEKKSKKQIEREKYVKETTEKLEELHKNAFRCRVDFIKNLSYGTRNVGFMLQFALSSLFTVEQHSYWSSEEGLDIEYFGEDIKSKSYSEKRNYIKELVFGKDMAIYVPRLIHYYSKDASYLHNYSCCGNDRFPVYEKEDLIEDVYNKLALFGYQMSDEEKQLLDGTHPLYVDKDAKEDKDA